MSSTFPISILNSTKLLDLPLMTQNVLEICETFNVQLLCRNIILIYWYFALFADHRPYYILLNRIALSIGIGCIAAEHNYCYLENCIIIKEPGGGGLSRPKLLLRPLCPIWFLHALHFFPYPLIFTCIDFCLSKKSAILFNSCCSLLTTLVHEFSF